MTGHLLKVLERVLGAHIRIDVCASSEFSSAGGYNLLLDRLILNLCLNARDLMPAGGQISIELGYRDLEEIDKEAFPWAKPGRYVALSVSDTGRGMEDEETQAVLKPFFSGSLNGQGSGYGLPEAFEIIRKNCGIIRVESVPGSGSTFRVFLPDPGPQVKLLAPERNEVVTEGTETILLADDEPAVRRAVQMLLQRSGYRVLVASDGLEAVEIFKENAEQIDLVLTDVVMPRMDGCEAARQILEIKSVPVLYCSGYAAGILRAEHGLPQGTRFLAKPYPPDKLRSVIREMLEARKTSE